MILEWFKSVLLWLWNNAVYYRPKITSSNDGHKSHADEDFIDSIDNVQGESRSSVAHSGQFISL